MSVVGERKRIEEGKPPQGPHGKAQVDSREVKAANSSMPVPGDGSGGTQVTRKLPKLLNLSDRTDVQSTVSSLIGPKSTSGTSQTYGAKEKMASGVEMLRGQIQVWVARCCETEKMAEELHGTLQAKITEVVQCNEEIGKMQIIINELRVQQTDLQGKYDALLKEAEDKGSKLENLSRNIANLETTKNKLQDQLNDTKTDKDKISAELESVQGELDKKRVELERASSSNLQLTEEIESLRSELDKVKTSNTEVINAKNEVETRLEKVDEKFFQVEAERNNLSSQLEEAKNKIANLEQKLKESSASNSSLQEEKTGLQNQLDEEKGKLEEATARIAEVRSNLISVANKVDEGATKIKDLTSRLEKSNENLTKMQEKTNALSHELEAAKAEINTLQNKVAKLKGKLKSEREARAQLEADVIGIVDTIEKDVKRMAPKQAQSERDASLKKYRETIEASRKQTEALAETMDRLYKKTVDEE
jgi:chromosome segregation ATPase